MSAAHVVRIGPRALLPVVLISLICCQVATAATPRPTLGFFHREVSAGAKPRFIYKAKGLPAGYTLYLQRQFGTRHVFKNVLKLAGPTGTGYAPGLEMGRYGYRLRAVRRGHTVARSAVVYVYSFGIVTLAQLCDATNTGNGNGVTINDSCGQGDSGTIQVGSSVFPYTLEDSEGNNSPDGSATLTAQNTSCRYASISYALDNQNTYSTMVGAQLTQSAADASSSSTAAQSVGSLNVLITSPDWDLEFWTDGGGDVYANGSFSCWTPTGGA